MARLGTVQLHEHVHAHGGHLFQTAHVGGEYALYSYDVRPSAELVSRRESSLSIEGTDPSRSAGSSERTVPEQGYGRIAGRERFLTGLASTGFTSDRYAT